MWIDDLAAIWYNAPFSCTQFTLYIPVDGQLVENDEQSGTQMKSMLLSTITDHKLTIVSDLCTTA